MIIKVNNVNIYYEVYGKGLPIILLHGNGESHEIFDKLINKLKRCYSVYAIDSRCHGKSENAKEISYDLLRDDIICFIKELKLEKPILYGFSDGGIIGLLIALKEPEILSKLIISGANLYPGGLKKYMLFFTKINYFFTKDKLKKMMLDEPNISPDELKRIKTKTIILAGEKDLVIKEHTKLIAENIPYSILKIIKNENHGSYIVHNEKIYDIIRKYI
ncbi:MAG: alpha/beta fold hydrolase [Eubacterium sp.]